MTSKDKEFVTQAGIDVLAGAEMSKLGVQKASDADVKALAQRLAAEHEEINEELRQLATTKGFALPAELGPQQKRALDHMAGFRGAEFDKTFIHHMVEGHQSAVSELEEAATSAADTDLRTLVNKTLPIMREHLALAQEVSNKL